MKTLCSFKVIISMILLGLLLLILHFFTPKVLSYSLSTACPPGADYMKFKHLGTLNIRSGEIDGFQLAQLSGLAWDDDSESLYAVSDKGYLIRFRVEFEDGMLSGVIPLRAVSLHDEHSQPLTSIHLHDAEGLAILNSRNGDPDDAVFLVSFEQNSRVEAYSREGERLYAVPLPSKLQRKEDYYLRNHGLESVMIHPDYGVIVAPELAMEKEAKSRRVLYATNSEQKSMRWQFFALAQEQGAVTGLEAAPDGSIIVLERTWLGPLDDMTIALRRIKPAECGGYLPCPVEDLAIFESEKGWNIDNFEGLAHYKGNQFFMVSDDNGFPLQKTLLTLFELKL